MVGEEKSSAQSSMNSQADKVKDLVQSAIVRGTAAQLRGMLQRLETLWDGSWTSSSGEVLNFSEKRVTETLRGPASEFPQHIDKTRPDRTSWVVKSEDPVTEEQRQSKIPAIRRRFARGPDDRPEDYTDPWKTAGIEVWELPGSRVRIDFIDAYAPYSRLVAGEALWIPIGSAFEEFTRVILQEVERISSHSEPKWLTRKARDEVRAQVPDVIQTIEGWIPKQRYRSEESYQAALAEYLLGHGIEAPEQQGMSLTDILAASGIGIELKLNPDRNDYDRLCGQIMRQLEEFGIVVVLIIRPDKRDLLEEYISRFAHDDRVIFITKG